MTAHQLSQLFGTSVTSCQPLGQSGHHSFFKVKISQANYFAKLSSKPNDSLLCEAEALEHFSERSNCFPKVFLKSAGFLVTQFIEQESPKVQFWQQLAKQLSLLHSHVGDEFGYPKNNYIGAAPQLNRAGVTSKGHWGSFFWECRIKYKLDELKRQGIQLLTPQNQEKLKLNCLEILKTKEVVPSLVHGDLWYGNLICGPNQSPYLIDPAIYYGDPEVDIAMTECFGGFANEFYQTYHNLLPTPAESPLRKKVYNLYHWLNHYVIFGPSYKTQVEDTIEILLAQS